jgi:PAS domain S-box-containing protein
MSKPDSRSTLEPQSNQTESPSSSTSGAAATVEQVIITAELASRKAREPDYRAENLSLTELGEELAREPEAVFQKLAESALKLCAADSAGVSLLEEVHGQSMFRWRATAGAFASLHGQLLPRNFSPCGIVIDRASVQLMRNPERFYPYISELTQRVHEVLLVPFFIQGIATGTLWVVAHNHERQFDAEDARVATSLAQFAAVAWQNVRVKSEAESTREKLREQEVEGSRQRIELDDTREKVALAQARFAAFFEQSPFYSGMLSAEGLVLEISCRALETCGYSRNQVVGKLFWETPWWSRSDESRQKVGEGFRQAMAGATFKAELPYHFADESAHVLELGLSPVFDREHRVTFVIVTGVDITERSKTEQALATAQRRLESALIAAETGVYEWEIGSDRLYGDANFLKLFGVPVDATGSASLSEYLAVIHPDDREQAFQLVQRSIRTGENFEADYRVIGPEGERWINSRGKMHKNSSGEVVTFSGVVLDITARKNAEKEREAIADEFRRLSAIHETVLSATSDFAYIFDRQGRFLYANRPLLSVWGRRLEEIAGKTCYDLGYPTWQAEMHMREIAQVIATGQPIRGEVPFRGSDGSYGFHDYIFTPVFGANGEVELIAGTTRDVTARRFSEDRDRFLVALDDATRPLMDPFEIVQASARLLGDHLQVNRCAYADVERDQNTFNLTGDYNRDVPSIVGRYRFDQFGAECLRLMRAGEPYVVQDAEQDPRTEAVRGSYRSTLIRSVICMPLCKAGKFVAAMAVHQTTPRMWQPSEIELVQIVANRCWESIERARVLRVLEDNEQQLRLAVETGRLGVWQLDLVQNTLSCSAQCRSNYGIGADVPFGYDDLWQAVHPEDRDRLREALHRAIHSREDLDIEYQTVWPDSSVHWVLMRGQASYTNEGNPQRLIGVSLDITARKQAEKEITRLHEEAVRGSRAKDDFLAALSHELRTPLNPVLLLASECADDPAMSEEARQAFTVIRKNVELEARLIDDLLDLTGIVRGKLTVTKQPVALHEVLKEAATALRADFKEKNIRLELTLQAENDWVDADRVRLLQVFLNLLRNAIKFTPTGGAVVVTTRREESEKLEVAVTDNGIGMTAQELDRVFGAFEQGDHAASGGSHRFGGLGLGLAIARKLVELHDGSIQALSAGRNEGASFVVRLPLTAEGSDVPVASDRVAHFKRHRKAGQRVLLIEDHEATRGALRQLLQRRQYEVVTAGSVAEGRMSAERNAFDFVISDIGLPDGDGAVLMSELRERFHLKGIALTGYGMEQDIARSRASGFVAHLTKPIRIEALESALAELND